MGSNMNVWQETSTLLYVVVALLAIIVLQNFIKIGKLTQLNQRMMAMLRINRTIISLLDKDKMVDEKMINRISHPMIYESKEDQ